MGLVEDGISILADVLIPAIAQLSAKFAIGNLLSRYLCAANVRTNQVEVVAVVDGDGATLVRQGEAVACACAFFKFEERVAVVEGCGRAAIRPTREGAVHRAARIAHLADRCAVVERDVRIVSAEETSVALNAFAGLTRDVNICEDILNEDIAVSHTDEGTVVDVCRYDSSLHVQIADRSVLNGAEQAAPLVGNVRVVISNGMEVTVEDSREPVGLACNHQVGIVACGQVDIGCQFRIEGLVAPFQILGKPSKILCRSDETEAFATCFQLVVRIPCAANRAEAALEGVRRNLGGCSVAVGQFAASACAVTLQFAICINLHV